VRAHNARVRRALTLRNRPASDPSDTVPFTRGIDSPIRFTRGIDSPIRSRELAERAPPFAASLDISHTAAIGA
jgi:hypothetical protein